MRFMW